MASGLIAALAMSWKAAKVLLFQFGMGREGYEANVCPRPYISLRSEIVQLKF